MDMTMEDKNDMISRQIDEKIAALQLKYDISYEDAQMILSDRDYNNLVCCGISLDKAEQIVFEESNKKSR